VGIGEAPDEVFATLRDIRGAGVEILTIGQYLQPTPKHLPVDRWVHPDEFARYREEALALGFAHCEAGPLVRSSYHAHEHVRQPAPISPSPSGRGENTTVERSAHWDRWRLNRARGSTNRAREAAIPASGSAKRIRGFTDCFRGFTERFRESTLATASRVTRFAVCAA
jgi:hypothetical protein